MKLSWAAEALRRESDAPAQIYQVEKQSAENVSRVWNMRGGVEMDALLLARGATKTGKTSSAEEKREDVLNTQVVEVANANIHAVSQVQLTSFYCYIIHVKVSLA